MSLLSFSRSVKCKTFIDAYGKKKNLCKETQRRVSRAFGIAVKVAKENEVVSGTLIAYAEKTFNVDISRVIEYAENQLSSKDEWKNYGKTWKFKQKGKTNKNVTLLELFKCTKIKKRTHKSHTSVKRLIDANELTCNETRNSCILFEDSVKEECVTYETRSNENVGLKDIFSTKELQDIFVFDDVNSVKKCF